MQEYQQTPSSSRTLTLSLNAQVDFTLGRVRHTVATEGHLRTATYVAHCTALQHHTCKHTAVLLLSVQPLKPSDNSHVHNQTKCTRAYSRAEGFTMTFVNTAMTSSIKLCNYGLLYILFGCERVNGQNVMYTGYTRNSELAITIYRTIYKLIVTFLHDTLNKRNKLAIIE
jgi:hypothetical protein